MTITLNGTTGIVGPNGTASAPAMTGTDTDTGIVYGTNTVQVATAGTTAVTVDSSQNVGIGTSSPIAKLDVRGILAVANSGASYWAFDRNDSDGALTFADGTTERMRIDTSGNLLVGTTDSGQASGAGTKINASTTVPQVAVVHNSSSAGSTGFVFFNTNGTNNGYRFYVRTDGGIYNYSSNNFNLSDETEKHDITLSGNYLDKLCQIPVKTFLFNDQNDNDLNLGVIAQDVEKVCPEFITQHNIGTEENPIIKLGVYETDLKYAMLKAIQELKAELDTVKTELATLKGTV